MDYSNPLFLIPILIGPLLVLVGIILCKRPPKKINILYGYRTAASMHSQERWDFAQTYSGRQLIRSGALLVISTIPGWLLNFQISEGAGTVCGITIMMIFIVIPIFNTESALKKKFGKV